MKICIFSILTLFYFLSIGYANTAYSQEIPILSYSTNTEGQVQLEINSNDQSYYILKIRHDVNDPFEISTSMTLGEEGLTTISEPLRAYPQDHYQVLQYSIDTPMDDDNDGTNDILEFNNIPNQNPINSGAPVNLIDGLITIDSLTTFQELSVKHDLVQWSEYLNGKEYVKFLIDDFNTSTPKVYFINSNTHNLHVDFANVIGVDHLAPDVIKGQIVYHPTIATSNGVSGTFAFNYSNTESKDFETVQRTHELLGANMLFLQNNLSYFVNTINENAYQQEANLYENSRVSTLFETDVYENIHYWGLNHAQGFGFFRKMSLDEVPGPRDIVLYDALPNSLPRVGGIMTSVIQTPLSHVNLRAIQDNIPNAYIRDPLAINDIANLLDHYIYFKVEKDDYIIREATLEEVNQWFEYIRPTAVQNPPLNLNHTEILPLEDIRFDMYDAFGAKCANVATMRTFGFPEGTIPNGFGVPFYYYQEFMKYNNFFQEVDAIINHPDFKTDRIVRNNMLKDFRKKIKNAAMPGWMLEDLNDMHREFPVGKSIRCRSSTNNEDLPGFSGAGLYTSKTQHPDEGHISKSIKQVYASLWNLRAFEEREFYRVNHFTTSMGVLCHPNYMEEKVNGVGVSSDPLYNTDNTFYLNTQVGENLITNPDTMSIPEEILLERVPTGTPGYSIVQYSNLLPQDSLVLTDDQLNQMREFLSVIHDEFAVKYNAVNNPKFAMDIEYKVTSDDRLIVKQARPWVSYTTHDSPNDNSNSEILIFPNPADIYLNVQCNNCELSSIKIFDLTGREIHQENIMETGSTNTVVFVNQLSSGMYILEGFDRNNKSLGTKKFLTNK